MDDGLIYIEGRLDAHDRERLMRLLRRVEDIGDFKPGLFDGTIPLWIVVIGWGGEEESFEEDDPVSVSRLLSGPAVLRA